MSVQEVPPTDSTGSVPHRHEMHHGNKHTVLGSSGHHHDHTHQSLHHHTSTRPGATASGGQVATPTLHGEHHNHVAHFGHNTTHSHSTQPTQPTLSHPGQHRSAWASSHAVIDEHVKRHEEMLEPGMPSLAERYHSPWSPDARIRGVLPPTPKMEVSVERAEDFNRRYPLHRENLEEVRKFPIPRRKKEEGVVQSVQELLFDTNLQLTDDKAKDLFAQLLGVKPDRIPDEDVRGFAFLDTGAKVYRCMKIRDHVLLQGVAR